MVECCLCPFDKCPENCPIAEVLPYEGPLKEESIRKAEKVLAIGMEIDEIKDRLRDAGSVAAKNELIKKWMEEYDSKEKDPLYDIIKTRVQIIQHQRYIDKGTKLLEDTNKFLEATKLKTSSVPVVDDESAPVAANEGLPGLKKMCVLCPFNKCPEDCPILEVLPYEGPLKEENIRKARKIQGRARKLEEIKQMLRAAGGVDAKNKLINKWIEEFDSRDDVPFVKKRLLLHQKKKILAQHHKAIEHGNKFLKALKALRTSSVPVVDDESAPVAVVDDETAPVAADEGLPGLKKCTSKN